MVDLSRREVMIPAAATAALAAGVPSSCRWLRRPARPRRGTRTDLYPSDAAWETERQAILATLPRLKAQKGTLGRSRRGDARSVLEAQSDISKRASRLFVYASLEGRRGSARRRRTRSESSRRQDVFTALGEATAWTNPEVVAIGAEEGDAFIAADPVLRNSSRSAFATRCGSAPHIPVAGRRSAARSAGTLLPGRRTSASSSPRRTFRGRR